MGNYDDLPLLYKEYADWWPILSAPEDYAEEAEFYRKTIMAEASQPPKTMLELGCGGGNNASHLKKHFQMTLVDLSPGMLEVSRRLNSECEHFQGDMRDFRLERLFDTVFIHDAIAYMITESDLRKAMATAYEHCRPDGVVLFAPDFTRESFRCRTTHGGHNIGQRSMRYLSWQQDPEPDGTTCVTEMVYLLREVDGTVRCVHDRHVSGLFSQAVWITAMEEAGLSARAVPFEHSEMPGIVTDVFVGRKRAAPTV